MSTELKNFEVLYSYPEYVEDVLIVQAPHSDLEGAEKIALDRLSDTLPKEVDEISIDSVRELN